MLMDLFLKECRQILKCTTYYVLIICIVLFYTTQIGDLKMLEKPKPGQKDYGFTYSKDETVIMDKTAQFLVLEYAQNNYVTYPVGFYKTVKLSSNKQQKMGSIAEEVTGMTAEELKNATGAYLSTVTPTSEPITILASPDLAYSRFEELMRQADKLLGGGSHYSKSFLVSNASVPMTYEEALAEYNMILEKDHISDAYARLFCDYIGILLAILPVFLAVTRGVRDKRTKAAQVIYVRQASSFDIIMSRYLSMVIMVLLPVLVMTIPLTIQCIYNAAGAGATVDYLAFMKYSLGWLLPSIMVSTSVGVILTELTETAIAIIVQGAWWFASLFMGIANLQGGYGWNLIPRHNTLGNYTFYRDNFNTLAANRAAYAAAALLLALAAVIIYDQKRKGKLIVHGKILPNRKSKSEA